MIQLLINITETGAEIVRCDGLIKSVEIPLDSKKINPRLGLLCSTPSLPTIIKVVAQTCEEAAEQSEILKRMSKLESMMGHPT
jgi:hypothetical protein